MRKAAVILIIYIIAVAGVSLFICDNNTISKTSFNAANSSNNLNSTKLDSLTNPQTNSTRSINLSSDTLVIPDNDLLLRSVQWDKYPLVSNGRITINEIMGPNQVINHTFVATTIKVDISDPGNVPELYEELSGIVIDQRKIVGQDSAPDVWGKVNGIDLFYVTMLPFDNTIYRHDLYHPVNNLTRSQIDASEID